MKITAPVFLLLIPLVSALFLSGCTPKISTTAFAATYEGYPCDNRCPEFQSGYQSAQNRGYTASTDCAGLSGTEQVGCLSYIHEYQLTVAPGSGYVFP